MTRFLAAALGLFALVLPSMTSPARAQGPWRTLLDGTNWNNFIPTGEAKWRVADGAVEATGVAGFLVSKESFGDFDLRAEFWVTPDANSGIFIRCPGPDKVGAATCYEVNIFDTRPDQTYRTGGIVDVAKPMATVNTGNRWNTMEISARGPRLIVRLNDMLMVDVQDTRHARGPFALQAGAGTVRWRSVQVR